ncbi:MAG TPA: ATP-binding protein, partial [Candidatus Dojkabacteria bacterium]
SLYTLTSNISKTLNPTEVAQNAVTSLPQDGNLIGGIIATKNLEDNSISAKAITTNSLSENVIKLIGDPSKYKIMIDDPKFKDNVTINAIEHGKIQYTDDLKEFLSPPLPQKLVAPIQKILNIKSVAVYPIIARQKIIGSVAYLFRNEKFEDMEDAKKQLFQTYTLQIGISLENARLFTESEEIRKRLKVALEKVEELRAQERDMIDIMGHELRTPITIVRNSLLVLEGLLQSVGKIPPETLEKYIGISVESSRREIALIETLLSATKVDGNRLQFSKEKVDMVDVVNDGLEGQLRIAEEKGLKVIYEKPSKQMYSYADRLRVQEVMDNLLNNSVKYTLKGHVEIKLYEENGMIRVDIIDTGIGISKEDIAKLGRKFFRAKQYIKATSTQEKIVRPGGTGLGLYVVFNLVKKMGGRIYIESELGKGSTFGFSLPKYDGQQEIKIRENSAREQESALKASRDPKIKKELDNEAKSTS